MSQDGRVEVSSGQHGDSEFIHGWAPGGIALDFRRHSDENGGDVAIEMDSRATYLLEMHYNSNVETAEDASGVEVCIQRTPPTHLAAVSWLGSDHGAEGYVAGVVFGTSASTLCLSGADRWEGLCDPIGTEPIHVMYMTPHMHETGVHMSSYIEGPGGKRPLHDDAFDFNYQVAFERVETIMPGETITTVCEFSEPKCSGQATKAEMCYLYTVHWPKGGLTDNMPWGQLAHGENVCLGM